MNAKMDNIYSLRKMSDIQFHKRQCCGLLTVSFILIMHHLLPTSRHLNIPLAPLHQINGCVS